MYGLTCSRTNLRMKGFYAKKNLRTWKRSLARNAYSRFHFRRTACLLRPFIYADANVAASQSSTGDAPRNPECRIVLSPDLSQWLCRPRRACWNWNCHSRNVRCSFTSGGSTGANSNQWLLLSIHTRPGSRSSRSGLHHSRFNNFLPDCESGKRTRAEFLRK